MKFKILILIPVLFLMINLVSAAWWNASWSRSVQINIKENSATALTNYSVLLRIPYDADMNTTFQDLRFTNSSNNTAISYWIENYTASNVAFVWVMIPNMIASVNTTIYMYYGNPTATTSSNITSTFYLGDDFDDASLNTALWQVTGTGTASEAGGLLNISSTDFHTNMKTVESIKLFSTGYDTKYRLRFYPIPACTYHYSGFYGNLTFAGRDTAYRNELTAGCEANNKRFTHINSAGATSITGLDTTFDVGNWGLFEIRLINSTWDEFWKNSTLISITKTNIQATGTRVSFAVQGTTILAIDWVTVRPVVYNEPNYYLGTEQTAPPVNTCTYTSGNWNVLFSDYCNITSNIVGDGSNLTITGLGMFTTIANITGFKNINCFGVAGQTSYVRCFNTGCFR